MNHAELQINAIEACEEMLRYGNTVANEDVLDALVALTDVNDALCNRNDTTEAIFRLRSAIDALEAGII